MKIYAVTDPDAFFVAGKRVPESRLIDLTDAEARYELLAGAITPHEPQENQDEAAGQARRARRGVDG